METSTLERDESRPPLMTITDELRVGEEQGSRGAEEEEEEVVYGGLGGCTTPHLTSTHQ